jgi:hypothetical protein
MAATVQVQQGTGAGPTLANAEGGTKFSKDDAIIAGSPTPVNIPTSLGTNYSWKKSFALVVTAGGGSTNLSNRKIKWASSPTTGLHAYFHDQPTYAQATGGDFSDDATSNNKVPTTYTEITTSAQTWHAGSAAATNSTRNGDWVEVVFGVGSDYVGGAGSAVALPALNYLYDEA